MCIYKVDSSLQAMRVAHLGNCIPPSFGSGHLQKDVFYGINEERLLHPIFSRCVNSDRWCLWPAHCWREAVTRKHNSSAVELFEANSLWNNNQFHWCPLVDWRWAASHESCLREEDWWHPEEASQLTIVWKMSEQLRIFVKVFFLSNCSGKQKTLGRTFRCTRHKRILIQSYI